jgi:hypothetical protein
MVGLYTFVLKIFEDGAMSIVIGLMLEIKEPLSKLNFACGTVYLARGRGM